MTGMTRHSVAREMWDEACRAGMVHSAYGIILEMFELWDQLESDPSSPASEHQLAALKEDLMHILGEDDGIYPRWREDWNDDMDVFVIRARDRVHECVKGSRP